jgi:hypothetical protein
MYKGRICGKLLFTERVIKRDMDPDVIYDRRIKPIRFVKRVKSRVKLFRLPRIISD